MKQHMLGTLEYVCTKIIEADHLKPMHITDEIFFKHETLFLPCAHKPWV